MEPLFTRQSYLVPCLVLVSDVAGDVGGDREELETTTEDLDEEGGDTDQEEATVLEPTKPLQHPDFSFQLHNALYFLSLTLH